MPSKFEYKHIPIANLLVNPLNPRFRPADSQLEAIDQMLINQGEKLVRLAEDIIENGINPAEMVIVTPDLDDPAKYVVAEGNRRVTTLKLLQNRALADNRFKFIHGPRFRGLANEYEKAPIRELYCVLYPTKVDTDHWVQLKHTGNNRGVGIESWDAQQTARFAGTQTGRNSEALQALDFLDNSKSYPSDQKDRLELVNSSTLDRLLGTTIVKEFLGLKIDKGILYACITPSEVEKGLGKLVLDILEGLTARKLDRLEDREKYLNLIPEGFRPDLSQKTQKWWALSSPQDAITAKSSSVNNQTTTTSPTKTADGNSNTTNNNNQTNSSSSTNTEKKAKQKPNPLSTDRETLIPPRLVLKITNDRANEIYDELKRIKVKEAKNAVSVLFRVFVELSTDVYLERYPNSGIDQYSKLKKKAEITYKHMEVNGFCTNQKLAGIRVAISDNNSILSIHNFNQFVHNPHYHPEPTALKIAWNNIEPYIEAIWTNV